MSAAAESLERLENDALGVYYFDLTRELEASIALLGSLKAQADHKNYEAVNVEEPDPCSLKGRGVASLQ